MFGSTTSREALLVRRPSLRRTDVPGWMRGGPARKDAQSSRVTFLVQTDPTRPSRWCERGLEVDGASSERRETLDGWLSAAPSGRGTACMLRITVERPMASEDRLADVAAVAGSRSPSDARGRPRRQTRRSSESHGSVGSCRGWRDPAIRALGPPCEPGR